MAGLGTLLFTWLKGTLVGTDTAGNRYYIERGAPKTRKPKRWVVYNGPAEASSVPAEFHAWLHHTVDAPLTDSVRREWQQPHKINATGTQNAYLPPGHDLRGGKRERATGDYQAWQP